MIKHPVLLDLFSGIGGFSSGIYRSGITPKAHYFSEIDKHAIAVYKHHFNKAIYAGSVENVSGRTVTERPNIITFGFPCQDLSIAGKRNGLDGKRSGLFFEAIRIVEEFQPDIFVFENVKGLLSSNRGKDFETVLRTIADIGLYECEWQLVNTRWVLPQNRERIYFIGHLAGRSKPRVFPFAESDSEFSNQPRYITESEVAQCLQSPGHACGNYKGMNAIAIQKTGATCHTVYENHTGTLVSGNKNGSPMDKIPNVMVNPLRWVRSEKGKQARKENQLNGKDYTPFSDAHRNLIPSDDMAVGCITNAVNKDCLIKEHSQIRRLTEIECERLQGFPDNWTEYGNYDGEVKKVSKTQRYKMLGNAVTVDIVEMIFNRLNQ